METHRIAIEKTVYADEFYLMPLGRANPPKHYLKEISIVGRAPGCDIIVNDEFVSSRHCRIEKKPNGFVLRDLQSRNGTYVNGAKITEAILNPNDHIRVGEALYVFGEVNATKLEPTSKNAEWAKQLSRLPAFAATDFPVLICGPSGSGKEILALSIHEQSARVTGPFISINCSALSESLIESELFGHVRGSFTGAANDRKGAFETARGGTLFLDEIGDLPLSLQPKLLRAIENKEIRPVGSDRTVQTNVRIIAATHKNLALKIQERSFREDLFYRLNVCQLRPPSLMDRLEDFDDLLYAFAKTYRVRFSFGAIEALKEHSWPGNVRELKNLVARASAYFPGKYILAEDLSSIIEKPIEGVSDEELHRAIFAPVGGTHGSVIRELEREMILRRLVANRGNQRQTARDLGVPKSTLHDRIKAYSINVRELPMGNANPVL